MFAENRKHRPHIAIDRNPNAYNVTFNKKIELKPMNGVTLTWYLNRKLEHDHRCQMSFGDDSCSDIKIIWILMCMSFNCVSVALGDTIWTQAKS